VVEASRGGRWKPVYSMAISASRPRDLTAERNWVPFRLSQLVRPGGTLAIVGFTRTEWRDWPWALTAFACLGVANRVQGKWEHTAPQAWPPPDTFRQLRRSLREALPGARISRLLMGRYLIIWHAPG
jgi:hypothetical protein